MGTEHESNNKKAEDKRNRLRVILGAGAGALLALVITSGMDLAVESDGSVHVTVSCQPAENLVPGADRECTRSETPAHNIDYLTIGGLVLFGAAVGGACASDSYRDAQQVSTQ
jgi:hypothetical protein